MNDVIDAPPTVLIDDNDPLLQNPVVQEMARQLRALDAYGTYDNWSDAKVIDPLIVTKERAREIPVVGDPDEIVMARVKAYYNGLACLIEQRCGLMATPLVSISHEGFGRGLILVGHLVVLYKTLRDVHRFGFESWEKLGAAGEKLTADAVAVIDKFPDAAKG